MWPFSGIWLSNPIMLKIVYFIQIPMGRTFGLLSIWQTRREPWALYGNKNRTIYSISDCRYILCEQQCILVCYAMYRAWRVPDSSRQSTEAKRKDSLQVGGRTDKALSGDKVRIWKEMKKKKGGGGKEGDHIG